MRTSPMRFILSLTVGVGVGYIVMVFIQSYLPSWLNYAAMPSDIDVFGLGDYMAQLPMRAVLGLVGSMAIGAFSGGYTAARIEQVKKTVAALGVGIFCLVIAVFVIVAFSYPMELAIGLCVVPVPFAVLGGMLANRI